MRLFPETRLTRVPVEHALDALAPLSTAGYEALDVIDFGKADQKDGHAAERGAMCLSRCGRPSAWPTSWLFSTG